MARLLHPRRSWGYPTLPSGTRIGRVLLHGGVYDPWAVYWEDGSQVAGCTFTSAGIPCANDTEGPSRYEMGLRPVPWAKVPATVRKAAVAQAEAWNASAGA